MMIVVKTSNVCLQFRWHMLLQCSILTASVRICCRNAIKICSEILSYFLLFIRNIAFSRYCQYLCTIFIIHVMNWWFYYCSLTKGLFLMLMHHINSHFTYLFTFTKDCCNAVLLCVWNLTNEKMFLLCILWFIFAHVIRIHWICYWSEADCHVRNV